MSSPTGDGVDLADGAAAAQPGDGDDARDWGELTPIRAPLEPQRAYPLDGFSDDLHAAITAIVDSAACSVPTAAVALLGSLNVIVQTDYDCETLEPGVLKPTSLYLMALSESGWRKSSAYRKAFSSNIEADTRAYGQHQRALAATGERKSAGKAGDKPDGDAGSDGAAAEGSFIDDRKLRKVSPIAMRSDATIEAFIKRLDGGRWAQALVSDDASEQLGNWSGRGDQRGRTMGKLQRAWDGERLGSDRVTDGGLELHIAGRRVSITWFTQGDPGRDWLLCPVAALGFTPRTLVAQDDARPDRLLLDAAQERDCLNRVRDFTDVIAQVRRRQDKDCEYVPDDDDAGKRSVARLSPEARAMLNDFHTEAEQIGDKARASGNLHVAGFWERAAEQSARLAANFAVWRWWSSGVVSAGDVTVDLDDVLLGCNLVNWHGYELERVASVNSATELAKAAEQLSATIAAKGGRIEGGKRKYGTRRGNFSLGRLIGNERDAGGRLRSDPEFRKLVLGILLDEGHIRYPSMGGGGGHPEFEVHPDLMGGWPELPGATASGGGS